MSNPNYMVRNDYVVGEDDPFLTNTWDRANIEMNSRFGNEHNTATGVHTAFGAVVGIESAKILGDVVSQIVSLIDDNIDVKAIMSFNFVAAWPIIATDTMSLPAFKRLNNTVFTETGVLDLGQGYYEIEPVTGQEVNDNGNFDYYIVWGWLKNLTGIPGTGTYSESEIDWLQDGDSIEISSTPDLANDPPTKAPRQFQLKFETEHSSDSPYMHKLAVFTGFGVWGVETLTYDGDGLSSQDVSLSHITNIKKIVIFSDTTAIPVVKTDSMSTNDMKYYDNSAIDTNGYLLFGDGEFTVKNVLNTASQEYHVIAWGTATDFVTINSDFVTINSDFVKI